MISRIKNNMDIRIQSLHFRASDKLSSLVNEEVNKLSHYNAKILSADVYLALDKAKDGQNKVCEIRLAVPGNDLIAKRKCETFEKALGLSVQALRRQLQK
jgi:putative sigma-54 modulation protein